MSSPSMQAYLAIEQSLPAKRRIVYNAILAEGGHGATIRSVEQRTGLQANRISGRLTELERSGLIYDTGARRDGQTVYAITVDGQRTVPGRKTPRRLAGQVVRFETGEAWNAYRLVVEVRRWGAGRMPPSAGQKIVMIW